MKHELTRMLLYDRWPKLTRPTPFHRQGKNYWKNAYRCPLCGAETVKNANSVGRNRSVYSDGETQVAKKRETAT